VCAVCEPDEVYESRDVLRELRELRVLRELLELREP